MQIDVGELHRDLADAGQPLVDHFGAEMVELEQNVFTILARAAAFLDLGRHCARHDVARGEVFHGRRIAFHETLAVLVEQETALAAHTLGNQHAGARYAGRVKLPELHVFERDAGARRHAEASPVLMNALVLAE